MNYMSIFNFNKFKHTPTPSVELTCGWNKKIWHKVNDDTHKPRNVKNQHCTMSKEISHLLLQLCGGSHSWRLWFHMTEWHPEELGMPVLIWIPLHFSPPLVALQQEMCWCLGLVLLFSTVNVKIALNKEILKTRYRSWQYATKNNNKHNISSIFWSKCFWLSGFIFLYYI